METSLSATYMLCDLIRSGPGDISLLPRLVTVAVRLHQHLLEFDDFYGPYGSTLSALWPPIRPGPDGRPLLPTLVTVAVRFH